MTFEEEAEIGQSRGININWRVRQVGSGDTYENNEEELRGHDEDKGQYGGKHEARLRAPSMR